MVWRPNILFARPMRPKADKRISSTTRSNRPSASGKGSIRDRCSSRAPPAPADLVALRPCAPQGGAKVWRMAPIGRQRERSIKRSSAEKDRGNKMVKKRLSLQRAFFFQLCACPNSSVHQSIFGCLRTNFQLTI